MEKNPGNALSALGQRGMRLAAQVITAASPERPTDRVLRETLKAARVLSAQERSAVSKAVFAYDRWRGWLEPHAAVENNLAAAGHLQHRFAADPASFGDEELVARAVPPWVKEHVEVSSAWVRSLQIEPRLWLRARPGRAGELAERLGLAKPAGLKLLPQAVEYVGHEDLFRTTAFHQGDFELQDLASQAVGICCDPAPGQSWWDACAGEGGKTLHLADLMGNKGLILATDRAAWRLRQLKRRTARARIFNYQTKLWVEQSRRPTRTLFDGVLVDAPCSGLGTWQRNPQARWTCRPEDIDQLSQVQWRLLELAADAVKPGGKLVYAVCTMTRAETDVLADRFSAAHPQLAPMPVRHPFTGKMVSEGRMTLWPQDAGSNGMFIAVWHASEDLRSQI